jgi:hypothetical protein
MDLPRSSILPIHNLSRIFNNTASSYKYYWFLALLDIVGKKQIHIIPFELLIAKMISFVWYPLNLFRLSFGKSDSLATLVDKLLLRTSLNENSQLKEIEVSIKELLNNKSLTNLQKELNKLMRFVPYRFIRPWFEKELRNLSDSKVDFKIVELSEKNFTNICNLPLYKFVNNKNKFIEIQKNWYDYFIEHNKILKDFCLWNLLIYVQKRNPNVPSISSKLFVPESRNLNIARKAWKLIISELKQIHCIYSDKPININNFSIDHFIPWSFVTHDLFWNLIPIPKEVNSSKGNSIPSTSLYFIRFSEIQRKAFEILYIKNKLKELEDYSNIFECSLNEIYNMSMTGFRKKLRVIIDPLVQIGKNMGYNSEWTY